ncbi:HSP20-like chaperone [Collybia nuda]|uniref:HSP20-like chaperone n=1 Tax=Collybia nuda TaxID=64659 RepID=A0A9P5XVP0_9AGAR|nr:HSP20-like chaperone [Collybia nuda]KAF9457661.1 HSP20-like chaperone [Collybia nuda]
MSIFLYEPFYDFDRLIDSAFNSHSPRLGPDNQLQRRNNNLAGGAVRSLRPRMDVYEDKDTDTVTAKFELPGMRKEDVSIDLHNGRLSVSGENKISTELGEGGYAVRERRFGKFSRTLELPQGVKDREIKASMENGILSVTFPKSAPEQASKKINIA